jgi:hypothetical protein
MFVEINTDYLLQELKKLIALDEMKEKIDDLGKASGFGWFVALLALIKTAIFTVEELVVGTGASGHGKEKRDAVVKFLDDVVQFKGIVGMVIEQFDSAVFGAIVDLIVGLLNKGWTK